MNMAMKNPTTTQIRNFYSSGNSYLNVSFYNNSLSLRFHPFMNKDQNGRDRYDMNNAETTTLSYDKVFALYELTKKIVDDKVQACKLELECNGGKLIFVYNGGGNVPTLTIDKNGRQVTFKFDTTKAEVMENGKKETKYLNTGLGVFMKTLDGYLSGINAERHLNKLTENYVASLQKDGNNNDQRGGYQNKGGYNRNNGGGFKKNYNNSRGNNYNSAQQEPAQSLDDYELPF